MLQSSKTRGLKIYLRWRSFSRILWLLAMVSGHHLETQNRKQETETIGEIGMRKTTEEDDVEEVPSSFVQGPKRKRSGTDTATSDTAASVHTIGICLDMLKQLPGLE